MRSLRSSAPPARLSLCSVCERLPFVTPAYDDNDVSARLIGADDHNDVSDDSIGDDDDNVRSDGAFGIHAANLPPLALTSSPLSLRRR